MSDLKPKYTDKDISIMFKNKMIENDDTIYDLILRYSKEYKEYENNYNTITVILNETQSMSFNMMKVCADYLDISFKELTELI